MLLSRVQLFEQFGRVWKCHTTRVTTFHMVSVGLDRLCTNNRSESHMVEIPAQAAVFVIPAQAAVFVIPAQAGIQWLHVGLCWIPACAGMTISMNSIICAKPA